MTQNLHEAAPAPWEVNKSNFTDRLKCEACISEPSMSFYPDASLVVITLYKRQAITLRWPNNAQLGDARLFNNAFTWALKLHFLNN